MKKTFIYLLITILINLYNFGQQADSPVWNPNVNKNTYKNPIIHADYSDPDVIRIGEDFYMVSSSFTCVPALPVLHSKDLVNWELIGHALSRLVPEDYYSVPQQEKGVWAPCLRYHNNEFYIYYPDPEFGIYMIKTKNPSGPWSEPVLVKAGKGLIDPSPLWDDDGHVYLAHAYAGSRAGIKSLIVVCELNSDGTRAISQDKVVFDGHENHPTIEGPKFYKRNDYYYIFAPGGGVPKGWQVVLRSKQVYGPYEDRIVLAQGSTDINGPHQGGLVELENGENWFLHFQEKQPYGRIVHLQQVIWKNDWPVMGIDKDNDGTGEPVIEYTKPRVGKSYPTVVPATSDEFKSPQLGLQWQWMANPQPYWAVPMADIGVLRLYAHPLPDNFVNFYHHVPNILAQKLPSPGFTATAKIKFTPRNEGEKAGIIMIGRDYCYISVKYKNDQLFVSQTTAKDADDMGSESESEPIKIDFNEFYLRVKMDAKGNCIFSISENNKKYTQIGETFLAREGGWIGAKVGLFITREVKTRDAGNIDIDWFRVE